MFIFARADGERQVAPKMGMPDRAFAPEMNSKLLSVGSLSFLVGLVSRFCGVSPFSETEFSGTPGIFYWALRYVDDRNACYLRYQRVAVTTEPCRRNPSMI